MGSKSIKKMFFIVALICIFPISGLSGNQDTAQSFLPLWTVLPFIALLTCIAFIPLINAKWWEQTRNQAFTVVIWSLPVFYYFIGLDYQPLLDSGLEYISFIVYVGGLYIVASGIFLKMNLKGTPKTNITILAVGSLLASIIGTPGASMLLIRPLLKANRERKHILHIPLFFIFLVSNIGGSLTPLGDPPLFLGFLRGVPFFWTLGLFPQWITAVGILLVLFYVIEKIAYRKEDPVKKIEEPVGEQMSIIGKRNFFLLGIIIIAVLASTEFHRFYEMVGYGEQSEIFSNLTRDLIIIIIAIISYIITPKEAHLGNQFTFNPIKEVVVLFAGIFVTMVPALLILKSEGASLGVTQPWQFFWITGGLSSFLDNAPTYLTFTSLAEGVVGSAANVTFSNLHQFIQFSPVAENLLKAISLGAVFMGANTYIGNSPNFMVRSIVQEQGVKMPSFFGYMFYSSLILLPVFAIITLIFFSS